MSILNAIRRFAVEFSTIHEHARTGRVVRHHDSGKASAGLSPQDRDNALTPDHSRR